MPKIIELSRKEFDVLMSIHDGLKYREIAEKLAIPLRTIHSIRSRIFKQLGVKSRAEIPSIILNSDYKFIQKSNETISH